MPIHSNLFSLITEDIPASFDFNDIGFINGGLLNYSYYLVFIISFVFIFYKNRRSFFSFIKNIFLLKNKERKKISKETFFIIYPILYISAYLLLGMTPFPQFYHTHLLPLYPFIFISIGLFTAHLYQKKNLRVFSIFLIAFVLLLGLKCNLDLLSLGVEERVDYLKVCDNSNIKHHRFIGDYLRDVDLAKQECQKLSKEEWMGCYESIRKYIANSYLVEKDIDKSINNCLLLGQYSNVCIQGLTIYAGGDERAPKICNFFPKEYQKECFFNFGMSIALNNKSYSEECKKVGDEYFNYCKKGYMQEKHK